MDRYLALKTVMMPWDTNPQGTIFGGVILSYIDQAAAVGARHEMAQVGSTVEMIVTVAMNRIEFLKPVYVGDVLSFYTRLVKLGRTSITIQVSVEAERKREVLNVTEAEVVYVAVAETPTGRRPVPIRPAAHGEDHGSRADSAGS
jgi:acyl-CoA thioesterase YciA